ncbi:uncharacterized protein LOC129773174 [Toxorhynchites rutilus septentrionalis]|uniref:uncharacterized protein LOC129773174 n=1 Tax=Toxorhynchites rutilus septentrionalis TaxID=329112 RepID=UPI00247A9B17|nr:uncharacterized protein LOC129773174 [Toxorhynchites rutilus septentrionalis]
MSTSTSAAPMKDIEAANGLLTLHEPRCVQGYIIAAGSRIRRYRKDADTKTELEKADGYLDTGDEAQISVRLPNLEEVKKEFYEIREKIYLLLEDQFAGEDVDSKEEFMQQQEMSNFQVLQDFDDRYCELKSKLLVFQRSTTPNLTSYRESSSANFTTYSKVKLPEIRLPSFSGIISDWITFRDTFRSLIHQNSQLTEVDKFTYLESSLVGDALQEVHAIELSTANYEVAWSALQNRYENKKLIVKNYLDALFAVEPLKKENFECLSRLIGDFEKTLQMLDKVGESTAGWSTILAHMVCARIDAAKLRCWETHHSSKDVPKYENILSFLRNHCSVLQSVMTTKSTVSDQRSMKPSTCYTLVNTGKCHFCKGPFHSAFLCAKFQGMNITERNEAVKKNQLCRNCLRTGQQAWMCERGVCHHCSQKHHSMLCPTSPLGRSSVPLPPSGPSTVHPQPQLPPSQLHNPNQQTHTNTRHALTATDSHSLQSPSTSYNATSSNTFIAQQVVPTHNVILSTALVTVRDHVGNTMLAQALLDSCSQHCLMTKSFANKLQFRKFPAYLSVHGIGSGCAVSTMMVSAKVGARSRSFPTFSEEMQFYVLPKLTAELPTASFDPTEWNIPDASLLTDPWFNRPATIDLIIGAEYYFDLLTEGQSQATCKGPTLQNTVLGWIVSGRVPNNPVDNPTMNLCVTTTIQDQLTKFWELETCRTNTTNSIEESACEMIYEQTTTRDYTERIVVTLPKKQFIIERLGESRTAAMKRFIRLERRFTAKPELREAYTDFIHEYQLLEHMNEVFEQSATLSTTYHITLY